MAQEDTVALCTGGYALTWVAGQLDADTALIDRALALDPNLAAAWHLSDWVRLLPARRTSDRAYGARDAPVELHTDRIADKWRVTRART